MKKLRFAALGAAKILDRYMGDALVRSGATELTAVAARDPLRAAGASAKFGAHALSYNEAVTAADIDAVYIPLPIGLHEEWAVAALEHGKHVLCEKSLSSSRASCERMIAAARANGVLLAENFMCEFHPQHAVVAELLRTGALGRISFFDAHFGIPALPPNDIRLNKSLGGGALNDVGAYLIFMSRFLFGEDARIISHRLAISDRGIDEQGFVHMEFPNGVQAALHFGFGLEYRNQYQIWGERGTLTAARAYSIPPDMPPPLTLTIANETTPLDVPAANHFHGILRDFARAAPDRAQHDARHTRLSEQARLMELVRRG